MNDRMRIGDLTQRAGVTQRTVRYYESIGLLPPGEREGHGQHYYSEETLARLRKIDQLKKLGRSLTRYTQGKKREKPVMWAKHDGLAFSPTRTHLIPMRTR
jgi:hypothetical protein